MVAITPSLKASDLMTAAVVTVRGDAPITQAIRLMLQNRISGLPVVDGVGSIVGVVTEGDFLRRAEIGTERERPRWLEILTGPARLAEEYTEEHGRRVDEVMTRAPIVVSEDAPIKRIVDVMERHRVKRVPVVRDNKVVGIVTRANLLHALAAGAMRTAVPAVEDATVRKQILDEMGRQSWASGTSVIVIEGIVHLYGTVFSGGEREALRVIAENVPGVKGVKDHLVWVEPRSGIVVASGAN